MPLLVLPQLREVIAAVLVLFDPLTCKRSILNVGQNLLHRSARGVAHNFFPTSQIAILGGIRNRIPHATKTAFINQIDDQLHLVQTLEVSDLRGVASLNQSLKSLLNQRRQPSAQHGLLAKQIALSLFFERGLQHARPRRPNSMRVSQRKFMRPPASILANRNQRRHAAPLRINPPQQVSRRLRSDHHHIHIAGRDDRLEMNAEPV